jgi:nucleoside-diphosphate-sugar epimerase
LSSAIILGCGFTGRALGRLLVAQGVRVRGTTRRQEGADALARAGVEHVVLDTARPETLEGFAQDAEFVFDMIPPALVRDQGGREAFVDPTADLIRASEGAGIRKFVYLGSTAVYGRTDADWVDEETPVRPDSPRARARHAAEEALRAAHRERGFPAVIVRAPGIYGPGRTLVDRIRRGEYRVQGDGRNYMNRIHVEDLAQALMAASERGRGGATYVVSDDRPERARVVADFCAALVGAPPPPSVDPAEAGRAMGESNFAMLSGNKRLCNKRMKEELGVILRYPSYREGIPASLE